MDEETPLNFGREIRKILIVRTSALGDVAHTLPSLDALRRLFPRAQIHWITEPLSAQLLEGHPHLDRLVVLPRQRWKKDARRPGAWPGLISELFRLSRALRREKYDLVLDFHCNVRSAGILLLAGGWLRVGFHRKDIAERGGALLTRLKAERAPLRMNKVEKNLLLVRALGYRGPCPAGTLQISGSDLEWARQIYAGLPGSGPTVLIHPAVSRFGELKRWPEEKFRALIDLLVAELDARVLITWGPGEREIAEAVGRPTVLDEVVPLGRFAALLGQADLLVAADTGALPIAAILGTPTVGIYGPKDALVYAPFPNRGELVQSTAPCSPCLLRRCEHKICMSLIDPRKVFESARRALEALRTGSP